MHRVCSWLVTWSLSAYTECHEDKHLPSGNCLLEERCSLAFQLLPLCQLPLWQWSLLGDSLIYIWVIPCLSACLREKILQWLICSLGSHSHTLSCSVSTIIFCSLLVFPFLISSFSVPWACMSNWLLIIWLLYCPMSHGNLQLMSFCHVLCEEVCCTQECYDYITLLQVFVTHVHGL